MKVVVVVKCSFFSFFSFSHRKRHGQEQAAPVTHTRTKSCAKYGGGTWDRRARRCASGKRAAPFWQAAAMNSNSASFVSRGRCATEVEESDEEVGESDYSNEGD
jgi:hypothetical protein